MNYNICGIQSKNSEIFCNYIKDIKGHKMFMQWLK